MNLYNDLINAKLDELLNCNSYKLSAADRTTINRSVKVALDIFGNDFTKDGQITVIYNLDVAIIAMKEIGLGPTSAVCSLLHGIKNKHNYSIDKIRDDFGEHVAEIVDGFNRISDLSTERISFQSETFRRLFLSMVDDMRVILVRLAHRLNDIRHIDILGDKLLQIVGEIKYLYIPIAHRLGLYQVKAEFEERVMKYEQPNVYNEISNRIEQTKAKRKVYIQDFVVPVEHELFAQHFKFEIKWRTKSVPSIWAKMTKQNVPFEEVYDLFAVRVIIDGKAKKEKEDCWKVYSIITNIYSPNPKRLRDWITTPKASGYESLHTTVMGPDNRWIEVQIRTVRMDEVAEKGRASHWQYKGVMKKKNTDDWISQVRDILENPNQINQDNSYKINQNKRHESVFVFTPKGDLKQLPVGSTILDFAFGIHTDIGAKCSGAKINNKAVPIRYVLKNGDKVDILTSTNQVPKLDWLSFVTTEKARNRIKRQLKEIKYKDADAGKALLLRKFKNWKIKSNDDLIGFLIKHFKLDSSIDLFFLIATEKLDMMEIKKLLLQYVDSSAGNKVKDPPLINQDQNNRSLPLAKHEDDDKNDVLYVGENLKNIEYRMAKCCNPIPGDKVFGFITTHGGISIHRDNCPNAKRLRGKYEYRVLEVKWVTSSSNHFSVANLRITGDDELGIVGTISKVIANDLHVNMQSINFQTTGKKFVGRVSVRIKNNEHLNQLIHKINKIKGVSKVHRVT